MTKTLVTASIGHHHRLGYHHYPGCTYLFPIAATPCARWTFLRSNRKVLSEYQNTRIPQNKILMISAATKANTSPTPADLITTTTAVPIATITPESTFQITTRTSTRKAARVAILALREAAADSEGVVEGSEVLV